MKKYLIVNADDFGLSAGVNRGIIESHERGIVTSASLMVRQPAAREAARYAGKNRRLSLGLHVDLGEWVPDKSGDWSRLYHVVDTDDADAVRAEFAAQLERFRDLVGRDPTHIDSHQHVHRNEPVRSIVTRAARRMGVPVRGISRGVRYRGSFYGQGHNGEPWPEGISVAGLVEMLRQLGPGVTEFGCHPGLDRKVNSPYRLERLTEVKTLTHPRVAAAVRENRILLRSFATAPLRSR
jgi:predicted glycoside hydrolase/deacetylase ChbG (UPF0249 family)